MQVFTGAPHAEGHRQASARSSKPLEQAEALNCGAWHCRPGVYRKNTMKRFISASMIPFWCVIFDRVRPVEDESVLCSDLQLHRAFLISFCLF